MKIGIIVYSETGHTLSVVKKLEERLAAGGKVAALEQVTVAGGRKQGSREFALEAQPDVGAYDVIVFASPVEAFSLCPVMNRYLKQTGSMEKKKVVFLVTQQLPYPWLGGHRAVRQMREICRAKGATVCGSGVVNWSRKDRDRQIGEVVETLSAAIGACE